MKESGFSILENVFILAFVLVSAQWTNTRFLQARAVNSNHAARLKAEQDIISLMQVTNEASICEHLNFVKSGIYLGADRRRLGTFDEIKLDGVSLVKKGKKLNYEIKSITLDQDSPIFGQNPKRAQAYIKVNTDFTDETGKSIQRINYDSKHRGISLVLVADPTGLVVGCYGSFSRRLACEDSQGVYDMEAIPNCKI